LAAQANPLIVTANLTTVNSETGALRTGLAPERIAVLPLLRNFSMPVSLARTQNAVKSGLKIRYASPIITPALLG
jgi:hypothetical protein